MKKVAFWIIVGAYKIKVVEGYKIDDKTFITKRNDEYYIYDIATGLTITHAKTRKECLEKFNSEENQTKLEKVRSNENSYNQLKKELRELISHYFESNFGKGLSIHEEI